MGMWYSEKYGVFLQTDDYEDGWSAARAEEQYEKNLKDLVKKAMFEIAHEDKTTYENCMKRLDEWRDMLNERENKEI